MKELMMLEHCSLENVFDYFYKVDEVLVLRNIVNFVVTQNSCQIYANKLQSSDQDCHTIDKVDYFWTSASIFPIEIVKDTNAITLCFTTSV